MKSESQKQDSFLTSNRKSISNFMKRFNILNYGGEKEESLNQRLLKYKEIKQLSQKTGLSPAFLLLIVLFLIGLIMLGFYEDHLTIILGTVYPLYFSLKTLKNGSLSEIKRWLTYWIFFISFIWFEYFFYYLLQYIPFYFVIRSVLLILNYLPQFEFSSVVYDYTIKVLFVRYHGVIRNYAKKLKQKLYGMKNNENIEEYLTSGLAKSISNKNFINTFQNVTSVRAIQSIMNRGRKTENPELNSQGKLSFTEEKENENTNITEIEENTECPFDSKNNEISNIRELDISDSEFIEDDNFNEDFEKMIENSDDEEKRLYELKKNQIEKEKKIDENKTEKNINSEKKESNKITVEKKINSTINNNKSKLGERIRRATKTDKPIIQEKDKKEQNIRKQNTTTHTIKKENKKETLNKTNTLKESTSTRNKLQSNLSTINSTNTLNRTMTTQSNTTFNKK